MTYLRFASIVFLLAACAPAITLTTDVAAEQCLATAAPAFTSELYNASVDVYGNHISGLMFFKTMPDSSQRVVFTTETGLTFFNFEWDKAGNFTPSHVIKKLNRKAVINLLRKDLELIVVPATYTRSVRTQSDNLYSVPMKKETVWFTTSGCRTLEMAEIKTGTTVKTQATFYPKHKNVPDSVYIRHLNFNMQLALKRIDRADASE
jgi:hypothetical protein